jgi:hypothetical protein
LFAVPVFFNLGCPYIPLVDGKPQCGSNCTEWIIKHCGKDWREDKFYGKRYEYFDFKTAEKNQWNEVVDRESMWIQ